MKQKKPFYKKWWVWAIVGAVGLGAVFGGGSDEDKLNEQVQSPPVSQGTALPSEVADNEGENVTSPSESLPEDLDYSAEILSALSGVYNADEISSIKVNSRNVVVLIQTNIGKVKPDDWEEIKQKAIDATVTVMNLGTVDSENVSLILNNADSDAILTILNGKVFAENIGTSSSQVDHMVWIPTNGGTKYHSNQYCSDMENPKQVTEEEAIDQGFTACKRCYG